MRRTIERRRIMARRWLWGAIGVGLLLGAFVWPLDGAIARSASTLRESLGGDLRRELETIQQFGDLITTLLIAWVIWAVDPARRRRLLDWGFAIGLTAVVVSGLKMFIGRPRPKFDDPALLLGPWGAYPVGDDVGVRHAWEIGSGISSDLWSMPSSHTAYAAVAGAFLMTVYPRLRGFCVALIVIVGACRVLFGAHYPSDVAVGAGIGLGIGLWSARRYAGVRLLDWLWGVAIDRDRVPALTGAVRRDRRR